jgi:hypothetical protein
MPVSEGRKKIKNQIESYILDQCPTTDPFTCVNGLLAMMCASQLSSQQENMNETLKRFFESPKIENFFEHVILGYQTEEILREELEQMFPNTYVHLDGEEYECNIAKEVDDRIKAFDLEKIQNKDLDSDSCTEDGAMQAFVMIRILIANKVRWERCPYKCELGMSELESHESPWDMCWLVSFVWAISKTWLVYFCREFWRLGFYNQTPCGDSVVRLTYGMTFIDSIVMCILLLISGVELWRNDFQTLVKMCLNWHEGDVSQLLGQFYKANNIPVYHFIGTHQAAHLFDRTKWSRKKSAQNNGDGPDETGLNRWLQKIISPYIPWVMEMCKLMAFEPMSFSRGGRRGAVFMQHKREKPFKAFHVMMIYTWLAKLVFLYLFSSLHMQRLDTVKNLVWQVCQLEKQATGFGWLWWDSYSHDFTLDSFSQYFGLFVFVLFDLGLPVSFAYGYRQHLLDFVTQDATQGTWHVCCLLLAMFPWHTWKDFAMYQFQWGSERMENEKDQGCEVAFYQLVAFGLSSLGFWFLKMIRK